MDPAIAPVALRAEQGVGHMTDVTTADDVTAADVEAVEEAAGWLWWMLLISGAVWVLVAFAVLAFDPTSAAAIGVMTGVVILLAGLTELGSVFVADGWRWVRVGLGAVFVVTGVMAMLDPFQTFGILALLIGWYLLLRGTFGVIFTLFQRHRMELWGLSLGAAVIELLIGLWAVGYPGRSAALLILWVGIGALLRGTTQIVFAFQIRGAVRAAV
jgi:uncharacterized membrane protein HdeD (DUF308 family)